MAGERLSFARCQRGDTLLGATAALIFLFLVMASTLELTLLMSARQGLEAAAQEAALAGRFETDLTRVEGRARSTAGPLARLTCPLELTRQCWSDLAQVDERGGQVCGSVHSVAGYRASCSYRWITDPRRLLDPKAPPVRLDATAFGVYEP